MIEDVKCAVRSLRAHAGEYNIDPHRLAAMGQAPVDILYRYWVQAIRTRALMLENIWISRAA